MGSDDGAISTLIECSLGVAGGVEEARIRKLTANATPPIESLRKSGQSFISDEFAAGRLVRSLSQALPLEGPVEGAGHERWWLFGFQRGVTVATSAQLGLPA